MWPIIRAILKREMILKYAEDWTESNRIWESKFTRGAAPASFLLPLTAKEKVVNTAMNGIIFKKVQIAYVGQCKPGRKEAVDCLEIS